MATKSSKIAVTLEPELKQKLREYGKENQIKNFSGVILAILDDYFDGSRNPKKGATLDLTSIISSFESLAQRVSDLEGLSAKGNASTPKPILKSKISAEGSSTADTEAAKLATSVPKAGTKKRASKTLGTSTRTVSPVASSSKSTSTPRKIRTSSTTAKSSSQAAPTAKTPPESKPGTGRSIKSKVARTTSRKVPSPLSPTVRTKSASAPKAPVNPKVEKAKTPTTKTSTTKTSTTKTSTTKTPKTKPTGKWMSTREAFEMFGGDLSWSRFSKLTPEELKARFNLNSDLSRKVRGSRFNQWLTLD